MSSKIVLCDIEGTTTSIAFVKDNLFPYAAKNVESFLDSHWDEDEIKEAVKMLRDQSEADKKEEIDGCVAIVAESEEKAKQIESIVANVKWQMEHDRKAGPLKNLQGIMWVAAYKAGAFKGQVYEDVAPAFEAWSKAGRKIYIYSSGSAAIQKVHFEHSDAGDLAKYLSGYYDTKVGAKQEKSSYETIFKEISKDDASLNSADVLFLTDVPAEAKAAKEAGMEAILLKRPGNVELTEEDSKAYKVVESFADIPFDKETTGATEEPQKRKIEADAQESSPPAKVAKIDTEAVPTPPPPANDDETLKKTEGEETKDVPMTEKVESSGEAKKTEEDAPEKADTMEVDSTTTTEPEKTATTSDEAVAKVDEVKEDEQKTPCEDVEMKGTASEAETKTVTDNESPKDVVDEKKVNDVEMAEEAKEKSEEVKVADPVEVAHTEKPAEEPVKENGSSTAEQAKETTTADKEPEKNGDVVESNGTEAKPQNGTKEAANGHDDSDKENDKSMEAQPDEVSTTSGPATETDSTADVVAAKKCAIDPQAPADQATPVPAEVEAES